MLITLQQEYILTKFKTKLHLKLRQGIILRFPQ